MIDHVVNVAHRSINHLGTLWGAYRSFVNLKWAETPSQAFIVLVASQAISSSLLAHMKRQGKKTYWLHSLLLTLATGFAGGFVAPLFMGRLPMPLENDFIIPFVIGAWYTTFYCGGAKFWANNRIANSILLVFVALFRTHTVMRMTIQASEVFKPNKYEHCALVGPIFIGTLLASTGLFIPQRGDGFASIEGETPWAMQSAFITSSFTHIMLNDRTGPIGNALRSVIGSWDRADITVAVASMHLLTIFAMTFVNSDSSLFELVHNVLYFITGVQGPLRKPAPKTFPLEWNLKLERVLNNFKVFLVVTGAAFVLTRKAAPTSLQVRDSAITLGGPGIGICTWLSNYRSCTPYSLALREVSGSLGYFTFAVNDERSSEEGGKGVTWSQKLYIRPEKDGRLPSIRATVDETGVVRVVASSSAQQETELWVSRSQCKTGSKLTKLTIDPELGKPIVTCSSGSNEILTL